LNDQRLLRLMTERVDVAFREQNQKGSVLATSPTRSID
jgi:hypothetical protein